VQYCGPQGRGTSVERYHLSIPRYSTGFAVDLRRERHRLSVRRALGLKWGDVDWLGGQIAIQRSVVAQVVDAPKTQGSGKSISVATELLQRLQAWKQITEFASDADWVFASPVKLGRLPYSYTGVVRIFRRAAAQVGISKIATHTFRHSFRSWMGAEGIPLEVQRQLMRHTTIGMTLNYGCTQDPTLKQPAQGFPR
jgi:integrase